MDKKTRSANIDELFSEKCFNSVNYEHDELAIISDVNITDVTKYCMNALNCNNNDSTCIVHTHYVTHDQVQCAINIKLRKSDCIDGMFSDNFKNGTTKLIIYISLLFSSMLTHRVAPGGLLLSKLAGAPNRGGLGGLNPP